MTPTIASPDPETLHALEHWYATAFRGEELNRSLRCSANTVKVVHSNASLSEYSAALEKFPVKHWRPVVAWYLLAVARLEAKPRQPRNELPIAAITSARRSME
jgi:hypothetical protein